MCGICGKLQFDLQARVSPALVKAMADTISHRGPDDEGYYVSGPIGLGFRRLSIIDLNTGHQPISNEDGSVWIVFNGEIYNYKELREVLLSQGHVFKTRTDTEVIVHLYEEFGERCVEKLRGMAPPFTPPSLSKATIQPVIDAAAKYHEIPSTFPVKDLIVPGAP